MVPQHWAFDCGCANLGPHRGSHLCVVSSSPSTSCMGQTRSYMTHRLENRKLTMWRHVERGRFFRIPLVFRIFLMISNITCKLSLDYIINKKLFNEFKKNIIYIYLYKLFLIVLCFSKASYHKAIYILTPRMSNILNSSEKQSSLIWNHTSETRSFQDTDVIQCHTTETVTQLSSKYHLEGQEEKRTLN